MYSRSPLRPYDPIIPQPGKRTFQYLRNDFMGAGQNSYARGLTENQELFQQLTNIMPVARGSLDLRYGYELFTNLTNIQTLFMPFMWVSTPFTLAPISHIYSYQNLTSFLRKLIYIAGSNIVLSNEDGTNASLILSSSTSLPRMLNSRDYAFFPQLIAPFTWPSGQQSDGKKWHSVQGTTDWGLPRPPSTISVTSTASAGNITLTSSIGRVYAGAYLNSTTGHYSDADTSLGSFASGSGGPSKPGTVTQDSSGDVSWSNIGNITNEDNSVASAALASLQTSSIILATNFGFTIPGTATITGVSATIKKSGLNSASAQITDLQVQLIKTAGTAVGDNKADTATAWPSSLSNVSYGGANDLWGLTLTPTDVNAASFGIAIRAQNSIDSTLHFLATGNIDVVTLTIYYATGSGVKTGAISGKLVNLTLPTSNPPTGVDKFAILATLDGGNTETLYILDTVPIAQTTYIDNTPDTVLVTKNIASDVDDVGLVHGVINNKMPPVGLQFPTKHRGRVFGAVGENLYFSKSLDDVTTSTGLVAGRYEEAWPEANFIVVSLQQETIRGLLSDGTVLYIGTERHIWKLDGDGPLSFSKPEVIFNEVGILNQDVWQVCFSEGQPVGMIWLTPDNRAIMSNFASYQDIGTPIQDVLNTINSSAASPAWAGFFSRQSYDLYILAIPTGSNTSPDILCVYDLRGGRWCIWQPADKMTSGLFNINSSGTPQWLTASSTGKVYNFTPTALQDRVGDTPVAITATVKTPWLHLGEPTSIKALNEVEVVTNDNGMLMTVEGASIGSQTTSPNTVVSNSPLTLSPRGYLKLYLSSSTSRDKHYRFTFTSTGGVSNVLSGFCITALPFSGF